MRRSTRLLTIVTIGGVAAAVLRSKRRTAARGWSEPPAEGWTPLRPEPISASEAGGSGPAATAREGSDGEAAEPSVASAVAGAVRPADLVQPGERRPPRQAPSYLAAGKRSAPTAAARSGGPAKKKSPGKKSPAKKKATAKKATAKKKSAAKKAPAKKAPAKKKSTAKKSTAKKKAPGKK